ncbi:hypothetical protein MRB53_035931 [Persea americana]|uniref:Uncharacterized protein n=1 Tax=Persea americana TaxID=3435 RepID=A0ACC2K6H9_PERAE|nr:hypothetical protein MRB53_035931 [Persea americana]|eukprot:TRINITY_DN43797_c0_g2_i1.p1 TRINITY_DN43797_c0_g2~~TRINITY_DN43797_c0_g2_i1.p1  ORF type:complete len:368 (-),score=80.10 TRINITY_DN43797_c0_g2_i1:465-1568(-)
MAFFFKTLRSNRFHSFLRLQNPSRFPSKNPSFHFPICQDLVFRVSPSSSSLFSRRISSLPAQEILTHVSDDAIETESEPPKPSKSPEINPKTNGKKKRKKKPLDLFFKEAVGLIEKTDESELSEEDSVNDSKSKGIGEMKKKLLNLERQVRNLKSNAKKDGVGAVEAKSNRLYSLFAKPSSSEKNSGADGVGMEGSVCAAEELSPGMVALMDRLFNEGYLINGNFTKDGKLNLNCISSSFSQDYLKFAVERFGEDHQENAKWLSGSDLKKVALFGCPSVERKIVFAAKSLRSFFSIHEDTVCQACKLKSSCKFAKQRVVKRKKLMSADALRVLTVYGLGSVPQQLVLTDEIKFSVNKLLKQVVNLSK